MITLAFQCLQARVASDLAGNPGGRKYAKW